MSTVAVAAAEYIYRRRCTVEEGGRRMGKDEEEEVGRQNRDGNAAVPSCTPSPQGGFNRRKLRLLD